MAKIIKKKGKEEEKRTIKENKVSNVVQESEEEKVKKSFDWNTVGLYILVFFLIVALVMSALSFIGIHQTQDRIAELQKIVGRVIDSAKETNDGVLVTVKEITTINELLKGKEDKFVPPVIPNGFTPDKGLIDIRNQVKFPEIPKNLESYKNFPNVAGVWGKARAGYYYDYNDAFLDVDRLGNVQIPTFGWVTFTGQELYLPGIGSLKDPNGGEVQANIINVWETPGEFVRAYLLHGCYLVGRVFDMSDMTIDSNSNPVYGKYTLETLSILRNHSLYNLTMVDKKGFNFIGQTGSKDNAKSVTWIAVIRWYDGKFLLIDSGQYVKEK